MGDETKQTISHFDNLHETHNVSWLNPLFHNSRAEDAHAIFLPSISNPYIASQQKPDSSYRKGNIPAALRGSVGGVNFLTETKGVFFNKWALISAGQVELDLAKVAAGADKMVHTRDLDTQIVGDSGGYQILSGAWKIDPTDRSAMDKKCEEVLRWQEHSVEVMMALDIPSGILEKEAKGLNHTNIKTFQQCLDITNANNQYFQDNRDVTLGKTLLNVLQGATYDLQQAWYEQVSKFNFEGWSFSWHAHGSVPRVIERLMILHQDGKLQDCRWIHFLGLSRLRFAGALTMLMRALREHVNPDIVISFDASSPIIVGGKFGQAYHTWRFPMKGKNKAELTFDTYAMPRTQDLIGSTAPFPFITSPIARELTLGDLCVNKKRNKNQSSWDSLSPVMMAAHNTYVHLSSMAELNRMMDFALKDMKKRGKSDEEQIKIFELPHHYDKFRLCLDRVFGGGIGTAEAQKARAVIQDYHNVLEYFDRKHTITMQMLGTGEPVDWGTGDLEEFAMCRETPQIASEPEDCEY